VTHGEIHRELAARRLTPEEAADAVMALRPRPSRGAWRGLALVAAVVAGTYVLFGIALGGRLP
jgi:ferric-dicitrate binding protein FerR (iron transport regulator)